LPDTLMTAMDFASEAEVFAAAKADIRGSD
jgi:hypothetical protein